MVNGQDTSIDRSKGKWRKVFTLMMALLLIAAPLAEGMGNNLDSDTSEPIIPGFSLLQLLLKRQEVMADIEPEPQHFRIVAVGDLMVHGPQIRAQALADGSHDFHNNFDYVRPWLTQADLVLGNLETTFAGSEQGYSSYPRFNTPDAFAAALKMAGFTAVSTANNHTIDTGASGFFRTQEVLRQHQLGFVGTRSSTTEEYWQLYTANGITVGVTAVTYETPRVGNRPALNGIPIPDEVTDLVNSFNYSRLAEDLEPVKQQVRAMKQAGADITLVMVHWGEEYQRQPNQWQQHIAREWAAVGADILLGSHPHVLQPVETLRQADDGGITWVAYSLGNFISNQRFEILKRHDTEDGAMLVIDLIQSPESAKVTVDRVSYQPTWVHRYQGDEGLVYEILPLPEALAAPEAYGLLSTDSLKRAAASYERTRSLWLDLPLAVHTETFH